MPKQLIFRNSIDTLDAAIDAAPEQLRPWLASATAERARSLSKLLRWIADAKDEAAKDEAAKEAKPEASAPAEGGTA